LSELTSPRFSKLCERTSPFTIERRTSSSERDSEAGTKPLEATAASDLRVSLRDAIPIASSAERIDSSMRLIFDVVSASSPPRSSAASRDS
jgi:hypothetical protein